MRYLLAILIAVPTLICSPQLNLSPKGILHIAPEKAHAYYGTGRRIARRTARRTARRVARRRAYYHRPPVAVYGAPVAAGIAIGATVASLPPSCSTEVINGVTYYNCGGTYYQPAYDGPNLVYVVVSPPR